MASLTTPFVDWTGGPAQLWVLSAALLYWLGGRGRKKRPGDGWRTVAFAGGLVAVMIALDSPVDTVADELFWVHMVQHILLVGAAAPLLAVSRPWARMWHGLPLAYRRSVARAVVQPGWRPLRRAAAVLGTPLISWLLFNVNFCAWHLPFLYDAALRWEFVHAVEHVTFFATALLFWTRVIPAAPWRSSLSELGKIVYLGSTMVVGWVLAIVLALAPSPLYSHYAEAAIRPGHISALTDQQLAAGVMWVPGAFAYLIAIAVIAYRWLEPRESPGPDRPRGEPLPRGVG